MLHVTGSNLNIVQTPRVIIGFRGMRYTEVSKEANTSTSLNTNKRSVENH